MHGHLHTIVHFVQQTDEEYHQMLLSPSMHMHVESSEQKYHESDSNNWYPDQMDWRNFGFVTKVKIYATLMSCTISFIFYLHTHAGEKSRYHM